jgi:hypothetical protein
MRMLYILFVGQVSFEIKKKAKAVPLHVTKALGGDRKYSSYSFLTSALDGGEWSTSRPGRALPPVPIVQEAGWTQSRSGHRG